LGKWFGISNVQFFGVFVAFCVESGIFIQKEKKSNQF